MRATFRFALLPLISAVSLAAHAAPAPITVTVDKIIDGKRIPAEHAVCLPTKDGKSDQNGKNLRPAISWAGVPAGTKSIAIFVMDPDVPADFTDAGKEGKTVKADAKRQDFFHYGVVGIPADTTTFPGGDAKVKPAIGTQLTNDMGLNRYVAAPGAFGGPCPPWNDEKLHRYHFIVLALDSPVEVSEPTDRLDPNSPDTAKRMYERLTQGQRVLGKGEVVGTYTLNPKL